MIILKIAPKRPFLDTKSAIELARQLKTAQNVLQVMRICSAVILSYLDPGFEPQCPQKEFSCVYCLLLAACCYCLLLLKCVAHPWTLTRGVKPQQGKHSSVIKAFAVMAQLSERILPLLHHPAALHALHLAHSIIYYCVFNTTTAPHSPIATYTHHAL